MGVLGTVMNVAKAGMINRALGRVVGGRVGTVLMVAYLGKKAFDMVQAKKAKKRIAY